MAGEDHHRRGRSSRRPVKWSEGGRELKRLQLARNMSRKEELAQVELVPLCYARQGVWASARYGRESFWKLPQEGAKPAAKQAPAEAGEQVAAGYVRGDLRRLEAGLQLEPEH